ncbi:MAG: acetyl-CoA C-acetyltransferase [Nitrososphaerota archaeon]|jgi:acetyl-CoA C-acetyltransferase|nr:acetyl-CoA C-acetyltransferase [Nitrososphaerota archaeon]MDG6942222.1 acetyl-CoA C-acetyltransferase [Nitrososphaerota archaeon]MDG6942687.1 acetyl-CoA C-acetyltransferase [Nitrososphaerota archaeon]MDG6948474.1 acetyl-CoA C-acetyltransferase [Nitrososphaerota archaeon]MDG6950400.1 acetyl-CoA C-acetyltransferase [Nitrososphaerota archaeon]
MAELKDAYVADYLRIPFSRSRPSQPERDVYNSIRMDQALSLLIRRVMERTSFRPEEVGDVVTGCAFQTGENWLYGGRHPVLLAGLPVTVPAMAMDRACASSMNAVAEGAMEIMTGNSDTVLAGGMEHLTHVPMSNNPALAPNTRLLTRPEYMKYQMSTGYSMGLTAEKLAEEEGFTREEMDRFSVGSHAKATTALDEGWFRGELLDMKVEVGGEERVIDVDQSIRRDTTLEQLAALQPSFKPGGLVTAGNSSPLNAGASMVALASEAKLKEHGLKPLARIVSMGWAGVDPSVMGKGPVPASQKALAKAKVKAEEVDLWEINEAFAAVVLYAIRELKLDPGRINVHGGAIAIGHPLGASGARLVGTLARELVQSGKEYGMATLCVGGGQGFAVLLQRA